MARPKANTPLPPFSSLPRPRAQSLAPRTTYCLKILVKPLHNLDRSKHVIFSSRRWFWSTCVIIQDDHTYLGPYLCPYCKTGDHWAAHIKVFIGNFRNYHIWHLTKRCLFWKYNCIFFQQPRLNGMSYLVLLGKRNKEFLAWIKNRLWFVWFQWLWPRWHMRWNR